MTKKITLAFKNLNTTSHKLIKYGCIFSTIILLTFVLIYIVNDITVWSSTTQNIAFYGIEVATAMLAEFIIGGIIFDYALKRKKNGK